MRLTLLAVLSCLALPACSGLNLGDNPGRDVDKQTGPLVIPPEHLKSGAID